MDALFSSSQKNASCRMSMVFQAYGRSPLVWALIMATLLLGYRQGFGAAMLMFFLSLAVLTDLGWRKIPNWLVLGGGSTALLIPLMAFDGQSLLAALAGGGLGLLMFLPLYLFRAMGAGDVKLMAMVGLFVGHEQIVGAVLATFLAGGLLALIFALRAGLLLALVGNVRRLLTAGMVAAVSGQLPTFETAAPVSGKMPYALAIAIGTLAFLFLKGRGWL